MIKTTQISLVLLLLSACGAPDRERSLNPTMPGDIVERLPLGVRLDSVRRDVNGCFFYAQDGAVFVVNDDAGLPICRP